MFKVQGSTFNRTGSVCHSGMDCRNPGCMDVRERLERGELKTEFRGYVRGSTLIWSSNFEANGNFKHEP